MSGYLTSLVPPLVQIASRQTAFQSIIVGRILNLSVTITIFNVPLTSVTWTHEENTLTSSMDRVTIDTSSELPATSGPIMSTLQVGAVEGEDSGRYTAIASHHSRNSMVHFNINITGELSITCHPVHML